MYLHKKLDKNIFKIVLAMAVLGALLVSAFYATAVVSTSYSNDRSDYRFVSDVKDSYTAEESKDIEISFINTNTGEKPVGFSVLMQIDNQQVQTVLSANSRTSSRFVNLGNLDEGFHQLKFILPEACGNYFDFSNFDSSTKFDNQFSCEFVRQFSVGQAGVDPSDPLPPEEGINGCTNNLANNYNPNATNNDGSCVFDPSVLNGCTDVSATNYVPTAQNDDGSCVYHTFGCTDSRALNYDPAATASDTSCVYSGEVTASDFECSANNINWAACEGRTFTLIRPDDNIYVRTEPQSTGTWSDWCTGDLNNGAQATFEGLTSNNDNAKVGFTFANQGSLFDMTLCLNPLSANKSQSFQRIKLKLLETDFIEN